VVGMDGEGELSLPRYVPAVRSQRPLGPFRGSCVPRRSAKGCAACSRLPWRVFLSPSRTINHRGVLTSTRIDPTFVSRPRGRSGPPSSPTRGYLRSPGEPPFRSVSPSPCSISFHFALLRYVAKFQRSHRVTLNFSRHARGGSTLLPARSFPFSPYHTLAPT